MTKLHKTEAEISRERADEEIKSRFLALRTEFPEVAGVNRFVRTICDERQKKGLRLKSPRGVLISLQRTQTI